MPSELLRQSMARRIAVEIGDQRLEPAARRPFDRLRRAWRGLVLSLGFGDQRLDRPNAFVAFPPDLAGELGGEAEQPDAFDFGSHHQPRSLALGIEVGPGLEQAEWAGEKPAGLDQQAVLLPLAEALLPPDLDRADFGESETADAPLAVGALLHGVGREPHHF